MSVDQAEDFNIIDNGDGTILIQFATDNNQVVNLILTNAAAQELIEQLKLNLLN